MEKSKIFADLLSDVSHETEIPEHDILSKRKNSECVDARHLFIYLLHRNGFYPSTIARMTGMCHRSVTYSLSVFDDRLKFSPMLRINLNSLKIKWGGRNRKAVHGKRRGMITFMMRVW